jgi:ArsR family transcriptional regulator, arsenate/arsenite/antimonite-responsive transcriptional repressor
MENQQTPSPQPSGEAPVDTRRWGQADLEAMAIRTEQDPQFFTPHLSRLRLLGLALSDPKRLLILGLLAEEDQPLYGQEIAERLGVTPQTISHHLHILKNGGLVRERRENAYRYYSLDTEGIQQIRETVFADNHLGLLSKTEARQKVVDIFFKEGRLTSIPRRQTQRRIILEELARRFEWGRFYSEPEINASLKQVFDDSASLRRYLIDEQIMLRENGRYWLMRPHTDNALGDK